MTPRTTAGTRTGVGGGHGPPKELVLGISDDDDQAKV